MQPGTCGYENETVLVDTDAMKAMSRTGVGIPVYVHHQDVDYSNMKEQAAGYVTDSFYNELDGFAWFKMLIIDDEARNAINKGWKVSNAYRPTEWGPSGTKNNVPYHREVRNGLFTHLAIVPDPRYEKADIKTAQEFNAYQDGLKRQLAELHNSKEPPKGTKMFKLFKNKQEEVTQVDGDTVMQLEDGTQVSVTEMMNAVSAAAKAEKVKEKEMLNAKTEVKVGDETMTLEELSKRFTLLNAKVKKNDDEKVDDEDMENEDDEDDKKEKKNKVKKNEADDEDEEKKKGKDKENSAPDHFTELRNAHIVEAKQTLVIETPMAQTQRGQQRYGRQA